MAFVPVILVMAVSGIVYANTHPSAPTSTLNPSSLGLYFEKMNYVSADGIKLEGWLVPVIDDVLVFLEGKTVDGKALSDRVRDRLARMS